MCIVYFYFSTPANMHFFLSLTCVCAEATGVVVVRRVVARHCYAFSSCSFYLDFCPFIFNIYIWVSRLTVLLSFGHLSIFVWSAVGSLWFYWVVASKFYAGIFHTPRLSYRGQIWKAPYWSARGRRGGRGHQLWKGGCLALPVCLLLITFDRSILSRPGGAGGDLINMNICNLYSWKTWCFKGPVLLTKYSRESVQLSTELRNVTDMWERSKALHSGYKPDEHPSSIECSAFVSQK